MATLSNSFIFLCFLLLPGVLAFAGPHGASYPCPCDCPSQKETQLHLFLHQFPAWDNVSNPNEVAYIGWAADHWLLTEGLYPSKNIVGRARGYHLLTGDTNKDWFAGSTIQVQGLFDGEWSIIGGTRAFNNARGYIKYKVVPSIVSSIIEFVKELDVHIFTPDNSTAVNGGVMPI